MEGNMQEYLTEKEAREKRLAVYTEKIQETVLKQISRDNPLVGRRKDITRK